MKRLKICARKREKVGKEYVKKIRRQGLVPGIIYKKGFVQPLELKETDLIHLLHQAHSENVVVEVEISDNGNKEVRTAIIKDVVHDPLKGRITHVDFQEVSLEEIIRIKVPIEIKGEPVGVKVDGGLLEHLLWELEVECKAGEIPEKLTIDVSELKIGDSITVADLNLPSGVRATGSGEQVIVHVLAPKVERVEEVVEEEAGAEPEVITEKKEEQEEESQQG
ncbi:MAG TPA: 50S ribosomal protein L25 [Candidatus Omnitrophica bacterium]|nr:50S ribosomal protein L25 [Candidatus Omnitrophota bacterium]